MKRADFPKTLQKFIYAVGYGEFTTEMADISSQVKIINYFVQLLDRITLQSRGYRIDETIHPDFFLFPRTELIFSQLFASLDLNLRSKVDELFSRIGVFITEFIGNRKNASVMNRLAEKLKERFPHLKELLHEAIDRILTEFFQPTVGDFLDKHKLAVEHLKTIFPATHALFVTPLHTERVRCNKLFNFYCNPWIYNGIMNYLALYDCLHSLPKRSCDLIEAPLRWLENCLQLVRSRTTDASWQELIKKAHQLCKASDKLEAFANQCTGLLGEIKAADYIIKNLCYPKDVLIFLPNTNGQKKKKKNCDLKIIRYGINEEILIEVVTKSPRHGVDPEDAADAQTWDDFFSNFNIAIFSYLQYLEKTIPQVLGLNLTKCFPLFSAFEGSVYGIALPLVNDILAIPPAIKNCSNVWSSEQKLEHVLRTLFFRPLILNVPCAVLPPDNVRLESRQQATKETLQKNWLKNIIQEKTQQLEEAYRNQKAEGHTISKLCIALNVDLSYRLLQDPLSNYDGNIQEMADKMIHEIFQPSKDAFAAKSLELELLLIKP